MKSDVLRPLNELRRVEGKSSDSQTGRQAGRQQVGRKAGRQTGSQTGRQTEKRQTDIRAHMRTPIHIHPPTRTHPPPPTCPPTDPPHARMHARACIHAQLMHTRCIQSTHLGGGEAESVPTSAKPGGNQQRRRWCRTLVSQKPAR